MSVLSGAGRLTSTADAAEGAGISHGSPAQQRRAKHIVRSSQEFRRLAARHRQALIQMDGSVRSGRFRFDRADVVFADDMTFAVVAVPAVNEARSVVATFLIDLQNSEVSYYYHVVSTPVGQDKKRLTTYLGNQTQADSHILLDSDYVVDADGRRLSSEQFVRENEEPEFTVQSNLYCVDCPQAACTPCRRQYYDICLFVVRRGGCGAFGLVVGGIVGRAVVRAVCSSIAGRAVRGCRGGCAAYANSTCARRG